MAFKVFLLLLITGIGVYTAPQYHHEGHYAISNPEREYKMNVGNYHMPIEQQQQQQQHEMNQETYSPYLDTEVIYKQKGLTAMPYYSGMMMQGHDYMSDKSRYQHEEYAHKTGYNSANQDDDEKSYHQYQYYGDEMSNVKQPYKFPDSTYYSHVNEEQKQQSYSPAAAVSHVKFTGMGTEYEWGSKKY